MIAQNNKTSKWNSNGCLIATAFYLGKPVSSLLLVLCLKDKKIQMF